MSTTTTTDEPFLQPKAFHGVLAFSFSVFTTSKRRCHYSPRIEDEQHAFFVYHLVANTHTNFPIIVYVCLLQSL